MLLAEGMCNKAWPLSVIMKEWLQCYRIFEFIYIYNTAYLDKMYKDKNINMLYMYAYVCFVKHVKYMYFNIAVLFHIFG